jgi:predicted kinase
MCKGLPASGKSTWAQQQVLNAAPGKAIRVNRDLLRTMLHAGRWKGQKTEGITAKVRDLVIEEAMERRVPLIISDDTNLSPKVANELLLLTEAGGYSFEVQDFTDVPLQVCIERDLGRAESVGEKVIRRMYNDFLAPVPADPPAWISGAASVVLVDVDGTLARMADRSPYEWHRVEEDSPIVPIVRMVDVLRNAGHRIVFLSGRDGSCEVQTERWLRTHALKQYNEPLLMRAAGDMRKDSIVKREIYEEHILGQYNVEWVLDDRDQVVEMWRSLGLTCLQVAPGAF